MRFSRIFDADGGWDGNTSGDPVEGPGVDLTPTAPPAGEVVTPMEQAPTNGDQPGPTSNLLSRSNRVILSPRVRLFRPQFRVKFKVSSQARLLVAYVVRSVGR